MSWKGNLIKAGISSDGHNVEIFKGDLTLNLDYKLYFRDSGCYIYSNADGYLTIEADTGVIIAANLSYTGTLTIGTAAVGIDFTGVYTTAGIRMGTNAAKLSLAAADDHAIDIHTTCAAATGTVQVVDIEHTHTGATYVTKIEALRVGVTSAVMTGDWVNALVGVITYTAPGTAGGGMAAAVCAEVNLPAQSMGGGTYTLFHGYLGVPTSCVLEDSQTHVVSFLRLESGGGAKTEFDDHGYFFQTVGLTAGAGSLLSVDSFTLKCIIEGTEQFLVMSDVENSLSFSGVTYPVASDNVSLINLGTYDTGISIGATSDNTFAVMNNLISTADSAFWMFNEYLKISVSTADQTSKSFVNLGIRQNIAKPIAATYGIQSHLTFATTGDTSSEVIALSAQINGTHAGSGLHWGVKSDLRHAGCPTAEQLSACFFGVGTVNCGSGVFIEALSGKTMAAGIRLHAAGTITTAISTAGGTITNLFSTFITNGPAVATAEAGDGAGSIKILVDGVVKYLHYWANAS